MSWYSARFVSAIIFFFVASASLTAAEEELANIKKVAPTIHVDLRYATYRNVLGRPIYPTNMPALARPHVAAQLAHAERILRERGYGLKIWDAYRPRSAHDQLWAVARNTDYVADPGVGGSLHTCGVAIDATLVDNRGREVRMPTDFDDFTPAAMLHYVGGDPAVRRHLRILQNAMARAGFYGMRTEWWHFISKEWKEYPPIPEVMIVPPTFQRAASAAKPTPTPAAQPPIRRATRTR